MGFEAVALIALALVAAPGNAAVTVTIASRALQPGELVVATIDAPKATGLVRVRAFNHQAAAFRSGEHEWKALIGIDLDVKPGTYPVAVETNAGSAVRDVVVGPKTFRTRRLTVNPDFVTPPPSEAARIAQD